MTRWTRQWLESDGFDGFVRFDELPHSSVPEGPGVYVVLRESTRAPEFLPTSAAGRFKGKDPSVEPAHLAQRWVPDTCIVYIGKAGPGKKGNRGLQARLDELRKFGAGEPVAHWGGRPIWQLADHRSLVVAWRNETERDPEDVEDQLLHEFKYDYGRFPYANIRSPRRRDT